MTENLGAVAHAASHTATPEAWLGAPVARGYNDAWLSASTSAVIFATRQLQCLGANDAARELVDSGYVRLTRGYVEFGDADVTAKFRAHLSSLGSSPGVWATATKDSDYLLVKCEAVEPDGLPPGIALTLRLASRCRGSWLWADLRSALGLTRTESLIVTRLIDGDRAEDIASDLGTTIETVRTHIRRTYVKLGVGAREQLFAKVLPFRMG